MSLLNRGVREHLLLDGEGTVQVDAHASQAFLCAIHFEDEEAIEMASGGKFWEPLITRYPNMTKDQVKEEVYRQIYGGKSDILNDVYPILASKLQKGKKAGRERCRRMQKIERKIFIDGVFIELWDEGIPAIPIHDCILCKESDRERVAEMVRSHWKAETGRDVHV